MEISWYGTAALCMSHAGHKILFDPFVSRNPHSPRISVPELAQMGDIFITHGHFDHTLDVPEVAALGKSKVYCSAETARQLIKRGAPAQQVVAISPGDIINNGPFTIRVLKGQHIKFDLKLIFQTLFNRRLVNHFREFVNIIRTLRNCPQGQVLIYEISWENTRVLHLGSLSLCADEEYPQGASVLCVPFQGRSDLPTFTLPFIEKLKPHSIFLHHFDDTFPPISSQVDCAAFAALVRRLYPEMTVIIPEFGVSYPIT